VDRDARAEPAADLGAGRRLVAIAAVSHVGLPDAEDALDIEAVGAVLIGGERRVGEAADQGGRNVGAGQGRLLPGRRLGPLIRVAGR
jgi:hypothetical protein